MIERTQVVCEKRTYAEERLTHDHHYGQLLLPLQGSMQIQTSRQSLQLMTDQIFFLPPNCKHTFCARDRNECLVVDIPQHYLTERMNLDTAGGMLFQINQQWRSIRSLLLEETDARGNHSTAFSYLIHYVCQSLSQHPYKSIQYIHDHYNQELRAEELASLEHYHPAYYSSWFKKVTGQTLTAYIHQLRLAEAKRLLLETDWSITNIAQQVGYANLSSFTRLFMKAEGRSPQAYRKAECRYGG